MQYIFPTIVACILFAACSNQKTKETSKAIDGDSMINNQKNIAVTKRAMDNTTKHNVVIDSQMTFEEAIAGTTAPPEIIRELALIDVEYYSDDSLLHRGQLVVNKSIETDIREIFDIIKESRFPVHQVIPIVVYNWDDDQSMLANNTSAFCYRKVAGTQRLSRHAMGKAIDINPFFNPLVWKNEYVGRPNIPEGARYEPNHSGTFSLQHPIVQEFTKRKFTWGYYLKSYYDYHHFHKN